MPGIYRQSDLCTGHPSPPCWPPRPPVMWSPNVTVNNLGCCRRFDLMSLHCCGNSCHMGNTVGVHTVSCNNLDVQVRGDPITCGSFCMQCSPNVTVDGWF